MALMELTNCEKYRVAVSVSSDSSEPLSQFPEVLEATVLKAEMKDCS